MKRFIVVCVMIICVVVLCACQSSSKNSDGMMAPDGAASMYDLLDNETYNSVTENPFQNAEVENSVYFTMDSNTSAYSELRRHINNGQQITGDMIRTDELLNYFNYEFDDTSETFTSHAELSVCPWNSETYLLTMGVKTKRTQVEHYAQGNNFVFLIDVSGSMSGDNRLPLVKKAFNMLVDTLDDSDTVSIVTYASGVSIKLEGAKGSSKEGIKDIINGLVARGSTYGQKGLERAYEVAERNLIPGGNNRILIASDGDFNVGIDNTADLREFVQDYTNLGIYVSTLGFGMGNYRDDMMRTIAEAGNGVFAYIDSIEEARKVLIDQMDNTFCVVAKDVKSKLEFNKDIVKSFRLIGYENKTIDETDYENEDADGGELGSNNTTMVCVEIKFQENFNPANVMPNLVKLFIKYKDPSNGESLDYANYFSNLAITDFNETTEDHKFAVGVVEFSLLIRNSKYKAYASFEQIIEILDSLDSCKDDYYKKDFLQLVKIVAGRN